MFWLEFFTVGTVAAQPGCYFAFEHAFPLPDTILALALVTSGANVIKGNTLDRQRVHYQYTTSHNAVLDGEDRTP